MVIKRDRYVNELLSKRWNGKVKIITGIRRCGKSFLLSNPHFLSGKDKTDILIGGSCQDVCCTTNNNHFLHSLNSLGVLLLMVISNNRYTIHCCPSVSL